MKTVTHLEGNKHNQSETKLLVTITLSNELLMNNEDHCTQDMVCL